MKLIGVPNMGPRLRLRATCQDDPGLCWQSLSSSFSPHWNFRVALERLLFASSPYYASKCSAACLPPVFFFFNKFIYLFVCFYFWLHWVFVAACGLSLVAASGVSSSLRCAGFSLQWLLLLQSMGSRHADFSSCGTWAQELWLTGYRAQAQ